MKYTCLDRPLVAEPDAGWLHVDQHEVALRHRRRESAPWCTTWRHNTEAIEDGVRINTEAIVKVKFTGFD
jgi:hypothetical protein